jgi:hypothetical protein
MEATLWRVGVMLLYKVAGEQKITLRDPKQWRKIANEVTGSQMHSKKRFTYVSTRDRHAPTSEIDQLVDAYGRMETEPVANENSETIEQRRVARLMNKPFSYTRRFVRQFQALPANVYIGLNSLQKFQEFWTVSNRPEIAKNRLEKGPYGFF